MNAKEEAGSLPPEVNAPELPPVHPKCREVPVQVVIQRIGKLRRTGRVMEARALHFMLAGALFGQSGLNCCEMRRN